MAEAGLTDPGALLATTHELEGGHRVRLRLTRPSDALGVREFLEGVYPNAVASLAIQQGATRLRGELPRSDGPLARLMQRLGRTVRVIKDGAEVVYTELPAPRRRAA